MEEYVDVKLTEDFLLTYKRDVAQIIEGHPKEKALKATLSTLKSKMRLKTIEDFIHVSEVKMKEQTNVDASSCDEIYQVIYQDILPKPVSCLDLLRKSQRLKMGCEILDQFLGGGFVTGQIIELSGEAGSGVHQLFLFL